MKLSDFKNLDPANIGSWPFLPKALVIVVLSASVLGLGFYMDTMDQMESLAQVEKKEVDLRVTFEQKQAKAANLEPLRHHLDQIKQQFGEQLRLLPNKAEIEDLLVEISQAGLQAGLEFELFKLLPEQPAEFYSVQPIQIRVIGGYHQFGEFVSAVAGLQRIVTQHNVAVTPIRAAKGISKKLAMDMVARTYRYLDEDEISAQAAAKAGQKGRRR
jgi:type IV pilus assembly protein PilO